MELKKEYYPLFSKKTLSYIKESENNSLSLLKSDKAYCFMCQKEMDAREIKHYKSSNGKETSLCPHCGLPTIICSSSMLDCSASSLMQVKKDITDHCCVYASVLLDMVDAYVDKKIDQSEETEALFLKNLRKLKKFSPEKANILLGIYYHTGGNFGKVNHRLAFKYFADPSLSSDGVANYFMGSYINNGYAPKHYLGIDSFACFSKSAMSGNYGGILEYALCFGMGEYVIPDPNYALCLLGDELQDLYYDFVKDRTNPGIFSDYCFAFCLICLRNFKDTPIEVLLRYVLLSMFALDYHNKSGEFEPTPLLLNDKHYSGKQLFSLFEDLGIKSNPDFSSSNIALDFDTFFDSFFNMPPVGKRKFKNIKFNQEKGVLEFDLSCECPQLLIDTGSFSIGFSSSNLIHFSSDQIEACNLKEGAGFDEIEMEENGTMCFYKYTGSGSIKSGSVVFKPTLKEIKEKLENEIRFASSTSNKKE